MAWIEINDTRVANTDNIMYMTVVEMSVFDRNCSFLQKEYSLDAKLVDGTNMTVAKADSESNLRDLMLTVAGLARSNTLIRRGDIDILTQAIKKREQDNGDGNGS